MADNYLENRCEDIQNGSKHKTTIKINNPSLNSLVLKNRSYRAYDASNIVSKDKLLDILSVCNKIPSARNAQVLRYRLVTADESNKVLANIRLGGGLPELKLPLPGTEPNAYLIICAIEEGKWTDMDLGIAAQTILLKAVEKGLGGICIGAFDKKAIIEQFRLPYEPKLILAIGKPAEKIQLKNISSTESHAYYRKDDIHYVPKIKLEDLIID